MNFWSNSNKSFVFGCVAGNHYPRNLSELPPEVQALHMAVIWHDERMTPERMIALLQEQRREWIETAAAFDRLKTYLTGTFSLQDAEGNSRACRVRAEQLQAMIQEMEQQCQIDAPALLKEEARQPYLQ